MNILQAKNNGAYILIQIDHQKKFKSYSIVKDITVKELSGNHAFQTVSASRPLLQRNATTGAYYLAFDGIDDFLVTNPIDFTATDKVSLFAGVRKLSDAATAIVVELSDSTDANQSTFRITAPAGGGTTKFQYVSRGSSLSAYAQVSTTNFNAPISVVSSCKSEIANDVCTLRLNGKVVATVSTDQGAGNYGNYPIYIGGRGGTSLPFNGHIYSLICISRLTTDVETLALEKAIAKLTGVTLNV